MISGDLCFSGGKFSAFDGLGYGHVSTALSNFGMTFGSDSFQRISFGFSTPNIDFVRELDDGRLEISMIYRHTECDQLT